MRDAIKWCKSKYTDSYFESTAKDDINVTEAFRTVARKALNNRELHRDDGDDLIELLEWE
jgi:hypothetical protein